MSASDLESRLLTAPSYFLDHWSTGTARNKRHGWIHGNGFRLGKVGGVPRVAGPSYSRRACKTVNHDHGIPSNLYSKRLFFGELFEPRATATPIPEVRITRKSAHVRRSGTRGGVRQRVAEHLAEIESELLGIEEAGTGADPALVNEVFRSVHSIKGAAGFMGFMTLGKLRMNWKTC